MDVFDYWSNQNCSKKANEEVMEQLEGFNSTYLMEYQQFYREILETAKLKEFNEEVLILTGAKFRRLVHQGPWC